MNGAEALLKTLVDAGIEVCFANPGTSEMHLVSAIGRSDDVRPILCLFEGVVTGAADGYARNRKLAGAAQDQGAGSAGAGEAAACAPPVTPVRRPRVAAGCLGGDL